MTIATKNDGKWMNDHSEQVKVDLVEKRFVNMVANNPPLYPKNSNLKVGEFAKSLLDMNENSMPPVGQWPHLHLSKVRKPCLTQEQMYRQKRIIMENESSKAGSITDQPYVYINFRNRDQLYPREALLGHSVIEFGFIGCTPLVFHSPEEDLIDASLVAGNGDGCKQAFLCARLVNGTEYLAELEDFFMLSLVDKNDDREKGILTVFSRKFGVLYNEFVEGSPSLKHAKLSFSPLSEDEGKEETLGA